MDTYLALTMVATITTAIVTAIQEYRWQNICKKCPLYIDAHSKEEQLKPIIN
jgi:hypothetical protein